MKTLSAKTWTALSLSAALVGGLAFAAPAQAAPLGALRGIETLGTPQVETVQVRRRVVRRRGGGNGAALAAGVLGAAVVGGAIIAESQRRDRARERAYYYGNYGNGYYGNGYGAGYAYDDYAAPVYVPRQRYYGGPEYYQPPAYGYPRQHQRRHIVRDPAGGGVMDPTYRP